MATPICQILTPVGCMGYGFDEQECAYHLAQVVPNGLPTAIILDAGSTDSGPQKLALGSMTCPRSAYKQDLAKLLSLSHQFRVPVIFTSAGGDGTDEHVRVMEELMGEICDEQSQADYHFKTISIFSGIDNSLVLQRLQNGRITGCGSCVPNLTAADVEAPPRIVAQAGPEPFVEAMEANPDFDVIIGGRAYDPAPYTAYATYHLKRRFPQLSPTEIQARIGGFNHMGKVMECGGACSKPKSHGALSTVYSDGQFDIRPTGSGSRCTPQSVAAHALYENTRPDLLFGPGGAMDLRNATYEQLSDNVSVRVKGARYRRSEEDGKPYCFKLEAGKIVGYRSIFMGSVRDHIMISQLDSILATVKLYVRSQHKHVTDYWDIDFHVYGKNQYTENGPGQVFIVAEALASTQETANSICSKARVGMIHAPYSGQKATAGNFGFGIGGKLEIEMGECCQFSIYHLMELDEGEQHLSDNDSSPTGLIRGSVTTFGHGSSRVVDAEFRQHIASLQNSISLPSSSLPQAKSSTSPPSSPRTLSDLCQVLRSKICGPYQITLDAIFYTEKEYNFIKNSGFLTRARVAEALGVRADDIVWMGFYEPALAFKVTIPRIRGGKKTSASGPMENDVHGTQEHIGLALLPLPSDYAKTRTPPSVINKASEWSKSLTSVTALGSVAAVAVARWWVSREKRS